MGKNNLPTIQELSIMDNDNLNNFQVLMNQEPPKGWVKIHPYVKGYKYIPRERMEYLLTRIFVKWWLEIKDSKLIANSVVVTVRLYVINPVTGETEWNDGIGASPLQTDKQAGAIDFNQMKPAAVQMSAPAAETYAFKDACEKFGKLFGKDLNVQDIDYTHLYKDGITDEEKKTIKGFDNVDDLLAWALKQDHHSNNEEFRMLVNERKKEIEKGGQ